MLWLESLGVTCTRARATTPIPLPQVSIDPSKDPKLDYFLKHFSGFDCVDNEATLDPALTDVAPKDWTGPQNPSYHYWLYHLWANIRSINAFRASRGQTTWSFRPHCGEAGAMSHLVSGFLLADGINHGINLRHNPPLQYLYYLAQVPHTPTSRSGDCGRIGGVWGGSGGGGGGQV